MSIPYGRKELHVYLPEKTQILHPKTVRRDDERKILLRAMKKPRGERSLKRFLKGDKETLFIVNDATRPTPTSRILDVLHPCIKSKKVRFIVATGSHRAPSEEERILIFGRHYPYLKDRIHAHDSRKDPMTSLGKTKRDTEIFMNRMVTDASRIVVIGSVEPHYFAGYTGGCKSISLGVASFRTIEQNHRLALDPRSRLLVLDGNPVYEDMREMMDFLKKDIFSIMTVLDRGRRICGASFGDLDSAFLECTGFAKKIYSVKVRNRGDVVITVAHPPQDQDLYQSHKAIENGRLALKDGGIIILVSPCREGIGPPDFFHLLCSSQKPQDIFKKAEENYVLGYHKAARLAELSQKACIWAVTDMSDSAMGNAFIKPYGDLQKAIDDALAIKGRGADILLIMDGGNTVPI